MPFFSLRQHPNPSLRGYACLPRQSFRSGYEPDTGLFCCDRLVSAWPSQSEGRSASEAESIDLFRLAFALARASSRSGRADATVTLDSISS